MLTAQNQCVLSIIKAVTISQSLNEKLSYCRSSLPLFNRCYPTIKMSCAISIWDEVLYFMRGSINKVRGIRGCIFDPKHFNKLNIRLRLGILKTWASCNTFIKHENCRTSIELPPWSRVLWSSCRSHVIHGRFIDLKCLNNKVNLKVCQTLDGMTSCVSM